MAGGYGAGPWGGGAFGGATLELSAAIFDLFCFQEGDGTMLGILSHPDVTITSGVAPGLGTQFIIDSPISFEDLEIVSGGAVSSVDAQLNVSTPVPADWTLEFTVLFDDLPSDFGDLTNRHIFVMATDSGGVCAGLFISQQGVAYAGGVHHDGSGDMILDSSFTIIPGSSAFVGTGKYITFRVAASLASGNVYVYITDTVDIPTTGQVLRAILPIITFSYLSFPPTDRTLITVRGTALEQAQVHFDNFCLASSVVIPNLAPVADAGEDQAVRFCSIAQLDGSSSFDPEGALLTYLWRLIDAPLGSEFAVEGNDGFTVVLDGSGFTDKFHTPSPTGALALLEAVDPIQIGDVLLMQGTPRTVILTGIDGTGFFLCFATQDIPDSLPVNTPYKVLRQRGISGTTNVKPTFFPDKPGFYKFDLVVNDGALESIRNTTIVNVLESPLPRGCTPNLSFLFNFLGDFWKLVEDRDVIPVFWGAIAQVTATELYTLWQYEYSKSLRDVQRQFVRRWLHYDNLLGEPLPELTVVRAVWGGIESEAMSAAGEAATTFTIDISSPIVTDVQSLTIIVTGGTITRGELAAQLIKRLEEIDDRFSVTAYEDRVTLDEYVRIDAPFPFTIDTTSTVPSTIFATGQQNRHPFDTAGGVALGSNTYRVNRSLKGLDIKEDDFLSLDGIAHRISRVIDIATDPLPFQRVVVKESIVVPSPTAWDITGWASSELINFYGGLVFKGDVLFFDVADIVGDVASNIAEGQTLEATVLGISEVLNGRVAFDPLSLGDPLSRPEEVATRFTKVLRRTYLPIDKLVQDIPTLSETIAIETVDQEQAVLRRNIDFFIEEFRGRNSIRFMSGNSPDVWEGLNPPNRLWAEYTFIDNRELIEENFGIPAELTLDQLAALPDSVDYLSAVRGLWYAYINGPKLINIRIGAQILLGLPFAEVSGTIEEIRIDVSPTRGRILIRDTEDTVVVRSYEFPKVLNLEVNPATGVQYAVGDTIEQFAPLVEGVEVLDYIKDPRWFEGLVNQGVFFEVEKYHKFLTRVDSAAFNLNALLFVRDFVLKIKPTYTFPLVVVQKEIGPDTFSVSDEVILSGGLKLYDNICDPLGQTAMYDDYRGDGTVRNQFDADGDPDNAAPTFPTPDATIVWAYDKNAACPADSVNLECCTSYFTGEIITADQCWQESGGPYNWVSTFLRFPGGSTFIPSVGEQPIPHDSFSDPTNETNFSGTLSRAIFYTTRNMASAIDPRVAATGSITTIAGSLLVDGETLVLDDGFIPSITFEFDDDGSVASGNRAIAFLSGDSADDVRDKIINVINTAPGLQITAINGGAATVTLTHDVVGTVGNIALSETVANAGFIVAGMSGGLDEDDLLLVVFVNAVEQAAVPFTIPKAGFPNATVLIDLSGAAISVTTTKATGTIATIGGALLIDGETFTLDDGINIPTVFEFDSNATFTPGNVPIVFTGAETADAMRDLIITAINDALSLSIDASNGGAATVGLTHAHGGTGGNVVQPADTVANAGFVVSNLTGGISDNIGVGVRAGSGAGRTYPWVILNCRVFMDAVVSSVSEGDTQPEGTYCPDSFTYASPP